VEVNVESLAGKYMPKFHNNRTVFTVMFSFMLVTRDTFECSSILFCHVSVTEHGSLDWKLDLLNTYNSKLQ
jgi:hypothetical protein